MPWNRVAAYACIVIGGLLLDYKLGTAIAIAAVFIALGIAELAKPPKASEFEETKS